MLRSIALLLLVLALPAVALAGCGGDDKAAEKIAEKAIEHESGGDVDIDDGEVSVTDEDGNKSTMSSSDKLPEDFPKEIPLPDGAKVTSGTKVSTDGNGDTFAVTAEVDDDPKDVLAFYKDELDGFKKEMEISTDDGASAQYTNDEWNVLLGVSNEDGKNLLSLTVTPGAES
jgi:hypothetical protein